MNNPIVPTPEDWEVVRQVQEYNPVEVPVRVGGIISTHALPAKRGSNLSYILAANTPQEIIPGDPRIKRVFLFTPTTNSNVIMGSEEQVKLPTPDGFCISALLAYPPWEGFEQPVWAVCSQVTTLYVRFEYWAD